MLFAVAALLVPALGGEAAPPATELVVVDAGAEPRALIRYRPKPGKSVEYEVRTQQDIGMTMILPDGTTQPIPFVGAMPATVQRLRNSIGRPEQGLVPVQIESVDVWLDGEAASPEIAAGLDSAIAGLRGLAFELTFDPQNSRVVDFQTSGAAKTQELGIVEGVAEQIVRQVTAFPDVPVGVGAQWRYDLPLTMHGLAFATVTTVTLRGVTRNSVVFDAVSTLEPLGTTFALPGLPPDAQVQLASFSGISKAEQQVDLRHLLTTGTQTTNIDMTLQVTGPQGTVSMQMHIGATAETRR